IQRQDLVVEALEPPLPLPHDLWLERPLAVPGRLDPHLPVLGDKRLRCRPVSSVAGPSRRLLVRLIAEVIRPLPLHRPVPPPPAPPAAGSAATATPPDR